MLHTSRMVTFSTPFPFFYLWLIILPSFKPLEDPLHKALAAALTLVSLTQLRVSFNQEYLSPGWSLEPGQRTNPFWAQLCIFWYFLTNRLGGLAEKFTDSVDLQAPEAPPLGDGHPEEISVISEKTIRTMWFFIHYCFQKPCQNICEENKRVIHAQQSTLGKAVSPGWIEAGSLPAPSVRLY